MLENSYNTHLGAKLAERSIQEDNKYSDKLDVDLSGKAYRLLSMIRLYRKTNIPESNRFEQRCSQ